ncbi:hypothetical protein M0R04_08460 [Candidatus Dojkabacteria bacterium]|jgi:DNA-directed RNA polymerase subunit RPC12/RpoP|nr:hypothetical protein [Candidatus Dojkabacteria bacterium]
MSTERYFNPNYVTFTCQDCGTFFKAIQGSKQRYCEKCLLRKVKQGRPKKKPSTLTSSGSRVVSTMSSKSDTERLLDGGADIVQKREQTSKNVRNEGLNPSISTKKDLTSNQKTKVHSLVKAAHEAKENKVVGFSKDTQTGKRDK